MNRPMKAFPLVLPDDVEIRRAIKGISLTNAGHIVIQFNTHEGATLPVLREIGRDLRESGLLGGPVALSGGQLILTFTNRKEN